MNETINLLFTSLHEMFTGVVSFLPTLVTLTVSLSILIIGWLLAKLITKGIVSLMRTIKIDTYAQQFGVTKVLSNGGVKDKLSNLIGCIAYMVMMVMVLITSVKAVGLPIASDYLDKFLSYIPHVIVGSLTLIIGMLLANVMSSIIYITAKNTDMPIPEVLRELTKYAIVVYVTIIYLKEIGLISLFVGTHYTIFIGGLVFAMALSFGLAGKDIAGKYLQVFHK